MIHRYARRAVQARACATMSRDPSARRELVQIAERYERWLRYVKSIRTTDRPITQNVARSFGKVVEIAARKAAAEIAATKLGDPPPQ